MDYLGLQEHYWEAEGKGKWSIEARQLAVTKARMCSHKCDAAQVGQS